ncbi:MAG: MFS transporter [Lautropia sp.]
MQQAVDEFRTPRPITGRRVVATGFVMAIFAWGLGFYGLSAYTQFLGADGRWSLATMSALTTLYFVAGSISIGIADRLAARIGRRRVGLAGVLALAGGTSLLAFATHPVALVSLYLLMAFGWASTSGTAITHLLAHWFDARRGFALSLALTGASVSGFTVVPAMVAAIGHFGAGTGIALVAGAFALAPLVALLGHVDQPRARVAMQPASTGGQASPIAPGAADAADAAARARRPEEIVPIFVVGLFAQVAFLAQQLPILTPRVGAGAAATAVGVTTAAAVLGRLLLGAMVDRADHRLLTAACFASQIAGMGMLLATSSTIGAWAGCVLFGVSVGNLITLPAVFVQREFPPGEQARVVSRIWSRSQFFYAFGPLASGHVLAQTGSGDAVLAGCAILQAIALALCLRGRAPRHRSPGRA